MSSPIGNDNNSVAPLTGDTQQNTNQPQNPAAGGSNGGFSSLSDLQRKEPEFYNLLVTGMGTAFCQDQKHKYDRIKQLSREWRSGG